MCVYLVLFVISTLTLTAFGLDMESSMGCRRNLRQRGAGHGFGGADGQLRVPASRLNFFSLLMLSGAWRYSRC